MKFTIVSHAGMTVESAGTSLMIDPWIVGSCYWRSWWNYPKAAPFASRLERLDYVYLTHLHWDHFHGPSLRKLPRSATLLVPEAHFPRFVKDGELFHFAKIVELPHGRPFELAPGLSITSYQYSLFYDSALAISDGKTTLLDLNDCKISGRALRQIIRDHPRIDFIFRSHSSASAYPFCVESEDPHALSYRSNEHYMREFADTARLLKPRYAIPFASSHCFLHRETFRFNDLAVSPEDVRRYFDVSGPKETECVVMAAGDSWDDREGFQLHPQDWFTNKEQRLAEYAEEMAPVLERQYALEEKVTLEFAPFRRYFQRQLDGLPRLLRRLFRPVVVFEMLGHPNVHWVVDYGSRTVYEAKKRPDDYAVRITVPPIVLKDCVYKRMFSTFSASKRLQIEIRRGHFRDYLILFQLLDMHEYGYFPLRNWFRPRFIRIWLRRWREVLDYLGLLTNIALRRGDDPLSKFVPRVSSGSESGTGQTPTP